MSPLSQAPQATQLRPTVPAITIAGIMWHPQHTTALHNSKENSVLELLWCLALIQFGEEA